MGRHLFMRRPDLDNLDPPAMPSPHFALRTWAENDDAQWLHIIRLSYGGDWGDDSFERCISSDEAFLPERLFLITFRGVPVGTAGAFHKLIHGDQTGYVHMMAVLPEFRRQGCGTALLNACLARFKAEGRRDAVLDTDETRLPAVRLYLRHGFKPFYEVPGDEELWAKVLRELK